MTIDSLLNYVKKSINNIHKIFNTFNPSEKKPQQNNKHFEKLKQKCLLFLFGIFSKLLDTSEVCASFFILCKPFW